MMDKNRPQLHLLLGRFAVSCLLYIWSCSPPSVVGTELFAEESFTLGVIDTLSLRVSTLLIDSIDTYKPNRLLLGFHEDELLGKALAAPFFEVAPDVLNDGRPEAGVSIFDSLTLALQYDTYSSFDTTLVQTISAHRLRESMTLVDDIALYNNSTFSYRETPLGTLRFRPRPGSGGEIEIRLSDGFGQELFEKVRDADSDLESATAFKSYFAGLALLPDTTQNAAVLGFTNTPQLRLYYRDISELPTAPRVITYSCDPAGDEHLFNYIQGDRDHTPFAPLQTGASTQLDSRSTDQVAALQGGTGLFIRIEAPFIRNLLELKDAFIIADAQLKIRPILEQASDQFQLPEILEVYWADEDNVTTAQNPYPALLHTDPEFGRDVYYQLNVQDFIAYQLENPQNSDRRALLLTFREEAYGSILDMIKVGNDQHRSAPMELLITLLDLK